MSSEKQAKISVIVPVYNSERQLKKCVDSLVSQTYGNTEIILVDDQSTDNSGKICDEYQGKFPAVRVIHLPKNGGVSAARNAGMTAATGDYIHFCDADDWLEPTCYQRIIPKMENEEADAAFFGWFVDIADGEKVSAISQADNAKCGVGTQYDLFDSMLIVCGGYGKNKGYGNYVWNKIYKKSSLFDLDGALIAFDTNISVAEDGIWLVQVGKNWQKGIFDSTPYYHYLRNTEGTMNQSSSYSSSRLASQESHKCMLSLLKDFNEEYYQIHLDACTKFFWYTAKVNPASREAKFLGKTLANIIEINGGNCPDGIAEEILWQYRVNNRNQKIMKRRAVKLAVKATTLLDKVRGMRH